MEQIQALVGVLVSISYFIDKENILTDITIYLYKLCVYYRHTYIYSLYLDVGPTHKAPPPVATQLVVPDELSDGPVTLTCYLCQHHMTTKTKTGPSTLSWALCACMCLFV